MTILLVVFIALFVVFVVIPYIGMVIVAFMMKGFVKETLKATAESFVVDHPETEGN